MQHRAFALATYAFALSMLAAADATATAQRTFVASYGLASNAAFNCSITKPCRGFSEALTVTSLGGEVVVLDSAGYGPVTITQSASIIAPPGVYAGVTGFAGDAIIINGPGAEVVLKGLTINGQGGARGIMFAAGASMTLEEVGVKGFTSDGIRIESGGKFVLRNVASSQNDNGLIVRAASGGLSSANVSITDSHFDHNGLDGIDAQNFTHVTVKNSTASFNTGIGFRNRPDAGTSTFICEGCVANYNASGFRPGGFGSAATMRLSNSVATGNSSLGVTSGSGGTTISRSNNTIKGNNADGTFDAVEGPN